MEGHDLFTQAETDTRASGFGCEKRNEDFIQSFRDDARSVVLDVDGDLSGVGLGGDADQGSRYIPAGFFGISDVSLYPKLQAYISPRICIVDAGAYRCAAWRNCGTDLSADVSTVSLYDCSYDNCGICIWHCASGLLDCKI